MDQFRRQQKAAEREQRRQKKKKKQAADFEDRRRQMNYDDVVQRIKSFHLLQKPTHIRLWDRRGCSFLKRTDEWDRRKRSRISSRESEEAPNAL